MRRTPSRCGRSQQWSLLVAICLAVRALVSPLAASAQPLPKLLLLDRGSPALARTLRAELLYAGFTLVGAAGASEQGPIPQWLERSGASALILVSSDEQVQLYISGEGEPHSQRLVRRPGEAESFPLRVVEQLRTRLVDLGLLLPPVAPQDQNLPAPAPKASSPPEPPPRNPDALNPGSTTPRPQADVSSGRLWLGAGLAATKAIGGLGMTPHGVVGARFEPGSTWGVGVFALLPLTQNEIAKTPGEAEVSVNAFSLEIDHSQRLGTAWWCSGGVGAGLLVLPMRSEAEPPLIARNDTLTTGLYHLELSAARRLEGWLRIRLSLLTGFSAPRPVLRFEQQEAAAWGRWFGTLALRGELGFPLDGEEH